MKKNKLGGRHPNNPFQKARVKAGFSQETAAEKLGCGLRSIQRYEEESCDLPMSMAPVK